MKKAVTLIIVALVGLDWCFPQTSDTISTDSLPGCQTFFYYYYNDSIKTFAEAYPYSFVDMSNGEVIRWHWDFGDGKTSDEPHPLHFYSTAGDTVLVCLTTTTSDSCESSYCIRFVTGDRPVIPYECKADFTIVMSKSLPPIYNFIPDKPDSLATYIWDFGDGSYSYEIFPDHRYEFGGNYAIYLNITYPNGCSAYKFDTLQAIGFSNECKAAWEAFSDIMYSTVPGISDTIVSPINRYYYYFQDKSRGSVVQWNWDFGDGTGSQEQNPQHTYSQDGIYNVSLDIKTADSCMSRYCDTLYVGMVVPYCSLTGTVKDYSGLDGCGLLIVLDNGEVLEPAVIVPNFLLKNGQRVHLSYTELTDLASVCMVGKIVRIDCIGEIISDSCLASFSHYPLPWVSSLPPIYQFEDMSGSEVEKRIWDLGDGTVTSEASPRHRFEFSGYYTVCLTIYTSDGCSGSTCETSYYEGRYSQPGLCNNFIKLNTEIVLNGQSCNGSASATLVNPEGNAVYAAEYLWSTGETGPVINNLCPGNTYSVIIIDFSGCAVSGSFSFGGDVVYPDSLFGYWNFEQDDRRFVFNIPVFSDSIYCEWDFGDGYTANGSSVGHTYESDGEHTVNLNVYDLSGKLLYNQQILVSPGAPTGIRKPVGTSPEVYPVPATDVLYLKTAEPNNDIEKIELLTSSGQLVIGVKVAKQGDNQLELDVSGLPAGFYLGKISKHDGSIASFRFVK
jgi:PKD repeat protein